MDHVVEFRHLVVGIGNYRKVQRGALCFFDVFCPTLVGIRRVDAEADDLHIALIKFGLQARAFAEFGGAYGREIFGMREEHRPAIANPLMKINWALGSLSSEIRGCVS